MSLAHLAIFALCLLGFAALAIGTERYAPQLVGFKPAPRARKASWILGWLLLALALIIAALGLETAGIGVTLWFGWFGLAGLALVFTLHLNWRIWTCRSRLTASASAIPATRRSCAPISR